MNGLPNGIGYSKYGDNKNMGKFQSESTGTFNSSSIPTQSITFNGSGVGVSSNLMKSFFNTSSTNRQYFNNANNFIENSNPALSLLDNSHTTLQTNSTRLPNTSNLVNTHSNVITTTVPIKTPTLSARISNVTQIREKTAREHAKELKNINSYQKEFLQQQQHIPQKENSFIKYDTNQNSNSNLYNANSTVNLNTSMNTMSTNHYSNHSHYSTPNQRNATTKLNQSNKINCLTPTGKPSQAKLFINPWPHRLFS
jgi:hypothetical protein